MEVNGIIYIYEYLILIFPKGTKYPSFFPVRNFEYPQPSHIQKVHFRWTKTFAPFCVAIIFNYSPIFQKSSFVFRPQIALSLIHFLSGRKKMKMFSSPQSKRWKMTAIVKTQKKRRDKRYFGPMSEIILSDNCKSIYFLLFLFENLLFIWNFCPKF